MKTYIVALALLCLGVVGCGSQQTAKQKTALNTDTFTITEADASLAGPQASNTEVAPAQVSNAVVNTETEAVQETQGSEGLPDGISIQKALKNLGFYEGEVDGKIGPKTKEAIREFQRKNNLNVDGKVGPKTWALLEKSQEAPAESLQL